MAEYIEREALIEKIKLKAFNLSIMRSLCATQSARACDEIADEIAEMPTADVVEVVRCKDCAYANDYGTTCHYGVGSYTKPSGYCHNGERKDGKGEGE